MWVVVVTMCAYFTGLSSSPAAISPRMSHVDHQQCPHLVGNLAHTLIVPFTAVSGATADDELRLVLPGEPFHLVIVDTSGLPVERIAYMMIEDA